MAKMILLRHGQSVWNAANIFTGWTDVDLSEIGEAAVSYTHLTLPTKA